MVMPIAEALIGTSASGPRAGRVADRAAPEQGPSAAALGGHLRLHGAAGRQPPLRPRQGGHRSAPARARARPRPLLGLPLEAPAGRARRAALRSVNQHPAMLPRHRGPIPLAWALRDGDPLRRHLAHYGPRARHRRDPRPDVDPVLDEGTTMSSGPGLVQAELALLPQVFERLAAGDRAIRSTPRACPGPACWRRTPRRRLVAQPARKIHNQVRAWASRPTCGRSRGRSRSSTEARRGHAQAPDRPARDAGASSAATGRSGFSSRSRSRPIHRRKIGTPPWKRTRRSSPDNWPSSPGPSSAWPPS